MDADWSVEATLDDPSVVVPWSDPSMQAICYVDLKLDISRLDQIAEARAWPEVRSALMILNAADSGVWTAKCDAWVLDEDERQLDFGPVACGFGMYVDVLPSSRVRFISRAGQQALAEFSAKTARGIAPENARADFVVRPAIWNGEAGFAVTLYVFGYGEHEAEARENWAEAVDAIALLMTNGAGGGAGRYNKPAGE